MRTATQAPSASKGQIWAGRAITGLIVLLLLADSVFKFIQPAPVLESCIHLGLPQYLVAPIGAILLCCAVLYAIPYTSILGAILLTGYLGGAVLTHLRVGDPLFSHALFPVYLGIVVWAGVYLREERLRALIPLRS